ncbi:hypothetical protein GQ43DRAFT_314628 [Delitschia confertaspora ATCC 74209]|uniref:Uncharacterized protein n=1 Tax=Delitschia confertaspora ATCC 74209 TaxID=1513339 RepID=A0A9P4MTB1_9PLEO|nr:hypothetical protein GQ43DRAFT_314628 [Delitschia confertaspora ATCC 74209]
MDSNNATNITSSLESDLNPNSRASVFSTILALVLCLLTQPKGSLLFPGRSGWFWRLSPISALLEAFIIIFYLLFLRRRPSNGKDDGAGMVMLSDGKEKEGLERSGSSGRRGIPKALAEAFERIASISERLGLRHGWRQCAAVLLLLRGAHRPHDHLSMDDIRIRLTHNPPRRTHLWTTFSMIFLILKLVSVKGSPWFTAFGIFYVISWLSVEAIVFLVHWRQFSPKELVEIGQEYSTHPLHTTLIWTHTWSLSTGLLSLSTCAIFSYSQILSKPQQAIYLGHFVFLLLSGLDFGRAMQPYWRLTKSNTPTPIPQHRKVLIRNTLTFLFVAVLCVLVLIFPPYSGLGENTLSQEHSLLHHVFYIFLAICSSFMAMFIYCIGGILTLLSLPLTLQLTVNEKGGHAVEMRGMLSMWNVVIFAVGLGLYLWYYEEDGTGKPRWLEWVGM